MAKATASQVFDYLVAVAENCTRGNHRFFVEGWRLRLILAQSLFSVLFFQLSLSCLSRKNFARLNTAIKHGD